MSNYIIKCELLDGDSRLYINIIDIQESSSYSIIILELESKYKMKILKGMIDKCVENLNENYKYEIIRCMINDNIRLVIKINYDELMNVEESIILERSEKEVNMKKIVDLYIASELKINALNKKNIELETKINELIDMEKSNILERSKEEINIKKIIDLNTMSELKIDALNKKNIELETKINELKEISDKNNLLMLKKKNNKQVYINRVNRQYSINVNNIYYNMNMKQKGGESKDDFDKIRDDTNGIEKYRIRKNENIELMIRDENLSVIIEYLLDNNYMTYLIEEFTWKEYVSSSGFRRPELKKENILYEQINEYLKNKNVKLLERIKKEIPDIKIL